MKLGIMLGEVGGKFDVLAMPDKHIRDQRLEFKQIVLAGGVVDGKNYERVLTFEAPAKFKKFAPAKGEAKKSKGK